jgi:ABC-type transporter Mla MlaB component
MLKIDISSPNGTEVVVALSGWIRREHLPELARVLDQARAGSRRICLDLHDVSLVDREGVEFLAACAGRIATLRACPSYLREWLKAVAEHAERNHEAS